MFRRILKVSVLLILIVSTLVLFGCSKQTDIPVENNNDPQQQQQEVSKEEVSVRLQWLPQSQFAGFYVAKAKGFYEEAGLDVNISNGGPRINGILEVAEGETDFATAWLAGGIQNVSEDLPVACVANYFPKSMLVLVSKKSSGINTVKDMEGQQVGQWGNFFAVPIKTFMRKNNTNPIYFNQGFDVQPFVDDQIKIASAMLYNEYNQILAKGVKEEDLNVFNFADNGVNFPEDSLFTSLDTIKNRPEVVKKFVDATLKGWNYAINNIDDTVQIVMQEAETAGITTTKEHQTEMLKTIAENIVNDSGNVYGELSESDFNFVLEALKENNLVGEKDVTYSRFYQPVK